MADEKKPKSNIFKKVLEASEAVLDAQISKARAASAVPQSIPARDVTKNGRYEELEQFDFGTAVVKDRYGMVNSQGFSEKVGSIGNDYLKLIALRSSVVSGIIRTRQNLVASYALHSKEGNERGWRIVYRDEESRIDEIVEELTGKSKNADERVLRVEAKKQLAAETKKQKKYIEEFISSCGEKENKPFDAKKWNFDSYLRASIYDSLVYDQMVTEFVEKEGEIKDKSKLSYFRPVDSGTIRYASYNLGASLTNSVIGDNGAQTYGNNILYPEEQLRQAEEEGGVLELDSELLRTGKYKYVQIVRSRVERAFTDDQLAMGIRNPVTDIGWNGYGLSELEVMMNLLTSHMQTEHFNISFFRQGFSAKGILHIKANLNRSKLDELRQHWKHLISGSKNSFQTPIMSGMDDVQWIDLNQNHNEMEFTLWMNYLIKMICSTYQIDPLEIGFGIRDSATGSGAGGMGGDNSSEKLENSRDKGFIPLMRFLENFINDNIMTKLNSEFKFEWTGLIQDDPEKIAQQETLTVKYKKTVNELRVEAGLEPLEFGDVILDPNYINMYMQMGDLPRQIRDEDQQKQMDMQQQQMAAQQSQDSEEDVNGQTDPDQDFQFQEQAKDNDHARNLELKDVDHNHRIHEIKQQAKLKKSVVMPIKIEYYK